MLASRSSVRGPALAPAAARRAPFTAVRAKSVQRAQRAVFVQAALKVGDKMDDYPEYYRMLKASDGKSVTLASYKGKQAVVLFFYPKAGTPGCTKEVCAFRDTYARFTDAGAVVFGISGDSPEENAAFAKAQNLQYPLLSDQSNILRKVFGIKADLMGVLPGRQTYVIDKDGKCVLSFNDQFNPDKHIDAALSAIKARVAA